MMRYNKRRTKFKRRSPRMGRRSKRKNFITVSRGGIRL